MAPTKIHDYVIGESVRTGKVEELRRVTEEIKNFHIFKVLSPHLWSFISTSLKFSHIYEVLSWWVLSPWNCASGKSRDRWKVIPKPTSHRDVGHNVQVMQRVTDGYELVIGHHDQEETIQTSKKHKKGHLCQASCIGDDPLWVWMSRIIFKIVVEVKSMSAKDGRSTWKCGDGGQTWQPEWWVDSPARWPGMWTGTG